MIRHRLGIVQLAWVLAACNRYELQPYEDCPKSRAPQSVIGWQVSAFPGMIEGHAITIDSLKPVGAAELMLFAIAPPKSNKPSAKLRSALSDDRGRVRMDSVLPGAYELRVRRLGYGAARITIEIPPDSGVQLVAALEAHRMMLDGCGYAMRRVKRPWWRPW